MLVKIFFFKKLFGSILVPTILLIMELLIPNENYFLDTINEEATKKLMAVIIGVGLSAIGLGIAIKSNGSTGGMDVVQKILSKYFHIPLSITMYLTDLIVVFLSGFVKMDTRIFTTAFQIENVVWGSLGVFATGIIVDVICLSLNGKRVVYIITDNPLIIKDMIYKEFDRGVTLSKVTGGYTNLDKTMIICTMDKKEAYRISSLVKELDEKSFTFITKCSSVIGEYERRSIF